MSQALERSDRGAVMLKRSHRGLSLVELLVGIAIGMIVVAAASMTAATQLSDTRKMLLEVQVQQDLRAAADIIARDLRRAGYWSQAAQQVWIENALATVQFSNPNRQVSPSSGSTGSIEFAYDRRTAGLAERLFGFCQGVGCSGGGDVIRAKFAKADGTGTPVWQPLTDDKTVAISSLTITPIAHPASKLVCPSLCPGTDDTACWPTLSVREFDIQITGHAISDPAVSRTMAARVRVRNDLMTLSVASSGKLVPCPAM